MPKHDPHAWRDDAACRGAADPDQWVHVPVGHQPIEPLRVCQGCPVRTDCLTYALELPPGEDVGVWGGTTGIARTRIRRGVLDRATAMAQGDEIAVRRSTRERLEQEEPWLLTATTA